MNYTNSFFAKRLIIEYKINVFVIYRLFFSFRTPIKSTIVIAFFHFFSSTVLAQKETNYWYFGQGAGIVFNGLAPASLTNGSINTLEGCSSISSQDGQLLFYTDGTTVWNKNHQVMVNGMGLWGNGDASQSSIIIKQPLSSSKYYIFTVDDLAGYWGGYGGIAYSIVDVNLQGGSGEITAKNAPLLTPTAEKVTAVQHANGKDIWVMTQQWGTNAKYAWVLTSSGLNTTPVISNIGTINNDPINNNGQVQGYMKFSHDGKKVASVISSDGIIELYDFDNNSGQCHGLITLNQLDGPYGLEFSPNDSALYATTFSSKIFQWDLSLTTEALINNSRTLIHQTPFSHTMNATSGLQLGLDGKIYVALNGLDSLSIIQNPNKIGLACNYLHNAIFLKNKRGTSGLPNFVQSLFLPHTSEPGSGENNIQIYSVPFTSQYSISVNSVNTRFVNTSIYNGVGQLLFRKKVDNINGTYTLMVDLAIFPKAIYILEVTTNETRIAKKILR